MSNEQTLSSLDLGVLRAALGEDEADEEEDQDQ